MTSALKVLVSVRELLSDEKRWTQGQEARDVSGDGVPPTSKDAVCWCLLGALYKSALLRQVCGDLAPEEATEAWMSAVGLTCKIASPDNPDGIGDFNDRFDTTHADVLRVLDVAIEKAQS